MNLFLDEVGAGLLRQLFQSTGRALVWLATLGRGRTREAVTHTIGVLFWVGVVIAFASIGSPFRSRVE